MCILDSVLILHSKYLPDLSHAGFKYLYTHMPKYSFVLPGSNPGKYLPKAIESGLLQLSRNFETIIGYVSADSEAIKR